MTVTPHMRFAAVNIQAKLERAFYAMHGSSVRSEVAQMISLARYWESFPESYTPEQVAAGQALIESTVDPTTEPFFVAIVEVARLSGKSLPWRLDSSQSPV